VTLRPYFDIKTVPRVKRDMTIFMSLQGFLVHYILPRSADSFQPVDNEGITLKGFIVQVQMNLFTRF